jgi:DNA gyrase/topoisomerase IV subunit B
MQYSLTRTAGLFPLFRDHQINKPGVNWHYETLKSRISHIAYSHRGVYILYSTRASVPTEATIRSAIGQAKRLAEKAPIGEQENEQKTRKGLVVMAPAPTTDLVKTWQLHI